MKKAALLCCLILLNGMSNSSTVAAKSPKVVDLARVTTFTASNSSRVTIRFPETIDIIKDLRYAIEGNGRVRGFILRKVGVFRDARRPWIQSFHIGLCSRRNCDAKQTPQMMNAQNFGRKLSGDWEMYLIADARNVSVTFQIDKYSGKKIVRLTQPTRAEIRTLTPRVHETTTDTVYSAGDFTTLSESEFGLVGSWFVGHPHGVSASGPCLHDARPADEELETAFMPGCPSGDGQPMVSPTPDTGPWGAYFTWSSSCCPVGLGGWYTSASSIEDFGAVAVWLDF